MEFKVIKNIHQYNQYCNLFEELVYKELEEDADKRELLQLLIEDFDNKTIAKFGYEENMNPVETLKYLMEENNLSKAELARQLCVSRQLITEIVNYKRNISKRMVMKLSKKFSMKPIAFSREYKLKEGETSAA